MKTYTLPFMNENNSDLKFKGVVLPFFTNEANVI